MADRITDRTIALVTYDERPDVTDDDRLLADALTARGTSVQAVPWSAPSVSWSSFDAVVVRSCWDYFRRPAEFHAWLDRLETDGARVFNDVGALRWNAEKTYLRDLEARDVRVIPTQWLERGTASSLHDLRRETGWTALVVKPTVSGGAHRTWCALAGTVGDDDARLATMIDDGGVMVQPLVGEIERDGEWSLVFIDGRYSHAVLKRPRTGDFRVQREHGGSIEALEPPRAVIEAAERILSKTSSSYEPLLYARVDGCVVHGELLLMELELLEPELFLRFAPRSAALMAEGLLARLG
jgi:glutathione synthase/RimK-type ligase-like ATP-grasp enzyme